MMAGFKVRIKPRDLSDLLSALPATKAILRLYKMYYSLLIW